jgi:hypothetical protein
VELDVVSWNELQKVALDDPDFLAKAALRKLLNMQYSANLLYSGLGATTTKESCWTR